MRFLVICRPAAGGDQEEFKRLVPAETAALRGAEAIAWDPGLAPDDAAALTGTAGGVSAETPHAIA